MDEPAFSIGKWVKRVLLTHKFRLFQVCLIVCVWRSFTFLWHTVGDVLKVRQPDLKLDRFQGNIKNRLTNLDHALGDGDLRLAFTTVNTDTVEWKLKLVREANHSVLFADVMGGNVLDLLTKILEAKVKSLSHFKVVILRYAREDCHHSFPPLERLAAAYPDRVHYFFIPQIGAEKVHIKTVIADFGKYFTLGGSVWVDNVVYHDSDSDFIFEDCSGRLGPKLWDDIIEASALFVHTFEDEYRKSGIDVEQLLRMEKCTSSLLCSQQACDFPYHCNSFRNLSIPITTPDVYFSGPGQPHNARLVDAMVEAIDNSKSRIVIAHKYFILPERLKLALSNAASRGLNILIVNHGRADGQEEKGDEKPENILHSLASTGISASNDIEAVAILAKGKNVKAYKFIGKSKLSYVKDYHKKVLIADDVLFGGSPNMGPKSMINFIDLEVAFRVQSKPLADEYEGVIVKDAETYCRGVHGVSPVQVVLAYLWHFVRSFTTFANY